MYESNDIMVSHPDHYQSETGLEVIDVIEAFTFDLKGVEATDTGNILKYMCRWSKKNGLQDLKKAKWYLTHLIEHVEKLEKENENLPNPDIDTRILSNIRFGCRKDAEEFVDYFYMKYEKYGVVTRSDVYAYFKWPTTIDDCQHGWSNINVNSLKIVRNNDQQLYHVVFPNIEKLEKENEK